MPPIDERARTLFRQFLADEKPAIEQLRRFVGGELRKSLDRSLESLRLLDQFVRNLTADPNWASSSLFATYSTDVRTWLIIRLAYYFAAVLRGRVAGHWALSEQDGSPFYGTPVFVIRGDEFSPIEIAQSQVAGLLPGGLASVVEAIERERALA